MRYLLLLLFFLASPAFGDDALIYTGAGGNRIVLENTKCEEAVSGTFRPDLPTPRTATYVTKDKSYKGCWIIHQGDVWILYEDGDMGRIPFNLFNHGDSSAKKPGGII